MSRGWSVRAAAFSEAQLLLDEVRASGLPAYFFDHGEHLLYLDGDIYDLRDVDAASRSGSRPLPHQVVESGVGIESGWRHAAGCACAYCNGQAPAAGRGEAVA